MTLLTMLINLCAALICVLCLAHCFRVTLVEAAPVFLCALVWVLYILAMLHHLSWIDWIALAVVAAFAVRIAGRPKAMRADFARDCMRKMTSASFVTAVLLTAAVAVLASSKVVTWWDDINFWATDLKSLYFLDGFAGRYGNVAPEFGDYPPGAQLVKWWFLHVFSGTFSEGCAFVGYYLMNLAFLFPLLRRMKERNAAVMFLMAAAQWFFPSIAEVYGYSGFCADLTMACIYGGFLLAVTDTDTPSAFLYYGRLALYLSVLVLVKSMGFVWAIFGLLFFVLYRRCERREAVSRTDDTATAGMGRRLPGLFVAAAPLVSGGSWLFFCLLMRRVAKTTATAVKYMTTDEYGISGYAGEFARAFAEAFLRLPLHKERSIAIDLTPLGLYLGICLIVALFWKLRILSDRTGRLVLCFSVVSGALFYAVIFVAHVTIFATETQYLEAAGMISSIERYGAPFTLGTLILLAGIWAERGERVIASDRLPAFLQKNGVWLAFILFVALTAGYGAGYDGLIGYRDRTEEDLAQRASMIGEDEAAFLDAVRVLDRRESTRVCYLRRGDAPRWVNNSYTAYEASPVSVVFQSVNLDDAPTDWIVGEIRASHVAYLYAEETDADAGAVFDALMREGHFSCGVLYAVIDDGASMKLTPVS